MRIDKFYIDSIVLTFSNLATGIIGFIFSILLSRELGAEGLGLYGLLIPVYILLLCFTSEGLITALSKISAIYYNKRDFNNINRTISSVFFISILWSLTIAFLVYFNSSLISNYIIKDIRTSLALKIACPALIFVALSAILKGYFYGSDQFKTASFIDIVEKFLRVIILLSTITLFSLNDVKSTVSAAFFALVTGEFVSFLLLYTFYRKNKRRVNISVSKPQNRFQLVYNVLKISSPLCVNGIISSILGTISTLILPRRLVYAGFSYDSALAMIGKFTGMALNITYLPFVIVGSMITVIVPDLSLRTIKNDFRLMEFRIIKVLKIAFVVGIATTIISLTIPDILGKLFYNRTDLDNLIRFAAISALLSYISAPTFGILNGLGKQRALLKNSIIISLEGLVLIYILTGIPAINIYGYGIAIIIESLTALILNVHDIKKVCSFKFPLIECLYYLVLGVILYFILKAFSYLLPNSHLILKALLIAILGFVLMFSMSGLIKNQIQYFYKKVKNFFNKD